MSFRSKRVFVTGGTSGIGRAVALAYAAEGGDVTVTGVKRGEVERFAEENHSSITACQLDVTDEGAIGDAVAGFERLDILVNCAGTILRDGGEFEMRGFEYVVDVNLSGTMCMCQAFLPLLEKSSGSIVNVASMLSFFGSGRAPAYSASKGGVAQLTKSLAIAWAGKGIRVNAVAPGWIETQLTRPLVEDESSSRELIRRTPMRRWGRPEDVAGAVLFLSSSAAEFITGVILPVDGGYSIA